MVCTIWPATLLAVHTVSTTVAARADNQTPTTTPVSLEDDALPYRLGLERVALPRTLPTP